MDWTSRQLKKERHAAMRWPRALGCLLLLALAVAVPAIQPGETTEAGSPASSLRSSVTPLYLEKSTSPYSLKPEEGWQVGGLNSKFSTETGLGALGFSGGYFYSRTTAQRKLIDPREGLPSRLGQETQFAGEMPGFFRMFQSDKGEQSVRDEINFQRYSYKKDGLSFSGGYAEVGADFKGLDALKQSLNNSDPATAKMLAVGMTQRDYQMRYTGVRGLSLTSSFNEVGNDQAGHAERGLTRETQTQGIGLVLGARQKLEYTTTSLVETWKPGSGAHVNKEVDTQTLRLSGGMGRKSEFAVGQLLTSTTDGAKQTDVTQRDMALKWSEWKSLSLTAGYSTKDTEQTGESTDTLTLNVAAPLSPYFNITGKVLQTDLISRKTGKTLEQNLLDLRMTSQLNTRLTLTTQYQDAQAQDGASNVVRDAQLAYAVSSHWKATCRFATADNTKLGETDRLEYGITGQVGSKRQPRQLSLYHRDENLPNDVTQGRTEVAYAQPIGGAGSPVILQLRAGGYDFSNNGDVKRNALVSAQVTALKPGPNTSLSFGYYNGPVVGANALTYRSWGQKMQANPDTTWKTADLDDYGEMGGELTHALTRRTKLVAKEYRGEIDGKGGQHTSEYGMEHRLGTVSLLSGRRDIETPGQADQQEGWWRMSLPLAQKLPTWATTSLRATIFSDSATWGFNQAPAWAALKPTPGVSVDRRHIYVAGKRVDGKSAQYATMICRRLFLQGSFELNPNTAAGNPTAVDAVSRGMVHLAYSAAPTMTFFGRYVDEGRLDGSTGQCTRTLGFIDAISKTERLQMQLDLVSQTTKTTDLGGMVYTLEYECAVNADDSLSLRARLAADDLAKKADRLRLEGTYRKTF